MKVQYNYASPSMCIQKQGSTTLGFSPDMSREERVSFRGSLKDPLLFRDSLLMLRDIVTLDTRPKKKERTEYFAWLESEIERQIHSGEEILSRLRKDISDEISGLTAEYEAKQEELRKLNEVKSEIKRELDKTDAWAYYNSIEHKFWSFLRSRDIDLWFVLDPVITVHQDKVSFEAFSLDESVYGCLSVDMDAFNILEEPKLGTTNIDFSQKLAIEMKRFRTYSKVELAVNPGGFAVDTGIIPEYIEKKIDLPDTWVKGFTQVSSAANLNSIDLELSVIDMHDICAFMRRHKANKSPRYMKWVLKKDEQIQIVFEPFHEVLTLKSVYHGDKDREEKIWGRRRWLIVEKLLPIAKSFQVKLAGFGLPQFVVADLGPMKMSIGFSAWSSNDWVKGTAFNIMNGYIGEGNYRDVYALMKKERALTITEIQKSVKEGSVAGIGELFKRGEAYFDAVDRKVRFRQLTNTPLPAEMYETTEMENRVQALMKNGLDKLTARLGENSEFIFRNEYGNGNRYSHPEIIIDDDGQIAKVDCDCKRFKKGARNISEPCEHVLALYIHCIKFTRIQLEPGKEYGIHDILEVLI